MADPILSLSGVTKRFDGFTAVDSVSFDVPTGAIAGLIGPNGAGKTTLFNLLAGVLDAESGSVHLAGQPIHGQPSHRIFEAGLARTFQIPRPFPEMTVLENAMTVPSAQAGETFWNNSKQRCPTDNTSPTRQRVDILRTLLTQRTQRTQADSTTCSVF